MSIEIPETIQTYCANAENTKAMDALIEAIDVGKKKNNLFSDSLEDYQKKCEVTLFVQKFKYDMWKFKYDLWKAVWGEVLPKFGYNIEECEDKLVNIDNYTYDFYVWYSKNGESYNFSVCSVDGDEEGPEFYIYASKKIDEDEDGDPIEDVILEDDNDELKNGGYTNVEEYYTRSCHAVWLNDEKVKKIEDKDIKMFRKAAESILRYIESDTGVKAKKSTKGKK